MIYPFPHSPQPPRARLSAWSRIKERTERPQEMERPYARFKPGFPFPIEGPLMPAPTGKESSRGAVALLKQALGVTTADLAAFLGVPWRTFQKWEQGLRPMDPQAWTLAQMAVRFPEVRDLLLNRAQSRKDASDG